MPYNTLRPQNTEQACMPANNAIIARYSVASIMIPLACTGSETLAKNANQSCTLVITLPGVYSSGSGSDSHQLKEVSRMPTSVVLALTRNCAPANCNVPRPRVPSKAFI